MSYNGLGVKYRWNYRSKKDRKIQCFVHTNIKLAKINNYEFNLFYTGFNVPEGCELINSVVTGKTDEYVDLINQSLQQIKVALSKIYLQLKIETGVEPRALTVCDRYRKQINTHYVTIVEVITEYANTKPLSKAVKNYYKDNLVSIVRRFINKPDIPIYEVTTKWVYEFMIWLQETPPNRGDSGLVKLRTQSSVHLIMTRLTAVMNYCKEMEYVEHGKVKMPRYHVPKKEVRPERKVSSADIRLIEHTHPPYGMIRKGRRNVQKNRLLFLFQRWTGMAYIDMFTIGNKIKDHIITDMSGKKSIVYNRSKTGKVAIIPFFKETEAILEELDYDIYPRQRLPVYRNGIKLLFRLYGIEVNGSIGAHTGRHAFGSEMLTMGFSMDVVSAMMGHSTTKETRATYAKIDTTKINAELEAIMKTA